jgi:hypothetical protein
MSSVLSYLQRQFRGDDNDRRPRLLRRVLPTSYATAQPLSGTQMARLHIHTFH